ncbi:hypothetical protein PR048_015052 [Dryococelus australis]|uniref:Uncharacterized protein n=1 Tax=Dryococelus australis TaxID=614101 RepID=A0ABQ9HFY1_9NEOP|nr:hypothetical protein PR048_015052 [Dryococelus australis]
MDLKSSANAAHSVWLPENTGSGRGGSTACIGSVVRQTIETKLMRSFKTNTGISHEQGISDNVISNGIVEMTYDSHGKLAVWFDNHPPFSRSEIMSIATGVVGDSTIINCCEAVTVGKQAMGYYAVMKISVDGGFRMHKVIWPRGCTVSTICEAYIKYVKSHYPGRSCCVVFDGYTNSPNSTKVAEQEQLYRMKKLSDRNLYLNTEITVKQDHFLSTEHNKSRLITPSTNKPLDKPTIAVIEGKMGKIKTNAYSTKEMEQLELKNILFLHAFIGCGTTSAAFRKSKVEKLGKKCLLRWYGATAKEISLNLYRYQSRGQLSNTPTEPTTRKAFLKCSPVCHNCHGNCMNCKLENEDDDDEELELPPTLVEELDENMEGNTDDDDEEYESQSGSFRPKRSKLL